MYKLYNSRSFLLCLISVVLGQYTKIKQSVNTQQFIIVIQKDTSFGCTRQPLSGFTFHKCSQKHVALEISIIKCCVLLDCFTVASRSFHKGERVVSFTWSTLLLNSGANFCSKNERFPFSEFLFNAWDLPMDSYSTHELLPMLVILPIRTTDFSLNNLHTFNVL